jgi:hypothetical protein
MRFSRVASFTLLTLAPVGNTAATGGSLSAQTPRCDTSVRTQAGDPSRYQLRDGNRCEGVYIQDIAGSSTLRVASVVQYFENFADSSLLPLRVEWSAPSGAPVVLRAYSLRSGVHYRMETVRGVTRAPYIWPTSVLRPLRMKKADIGVVGVATVALNGAPREVYVPLRITQRLPSVKSAVYQVTLWSSVELGEVFVSVATTNGTGGPVQYIERDRKLGYGFYPAARGISVQLPPLTKRGLYSVRIGATRKSGGSVTTTFLLYHDGTQPVGSGR